MSDSPINHSRPRPRPWGRWLLLGFLGAGALAVAAVFGFSLWLNSYLHSDAFRGLVSQKTSTALRAEGQYMPFHWTGFSVYSDGYAARGVPGTAVTELRADQIRAEFHPQGVFHHAWEINDLTIQRLQVVVGAGPQAPAGPVARPPATTGESPRSAWIPDRLELQRVQIQDASLTWTNGALRQVRLVIEPEEAAWVVRGFGGQLRRAGWPDLGVDHLRVRYQAPVLFVTEGLLKLGEAGNLSLTGQINFEPNPHGELQGKISGVPITPYLPADWRAKLKGNASGDARLTGALGDADSHRIAGQLSLAGGQLEALPVLDRIALFTQTVQFRSLTLQKAAADFVWTKARLTVSHLVLESEGLLRVEGDCVVERGQLTGTFQVGVTPSSLRWLPGSQTRVFTQERDGYVWTTVMVSGPLDNLHEDLSDRLISAAGTAVFEGVKGTVEKGAKSVLDLLTPLVP